MTYKFRAECEIDAEQFQEENVDVISDLEINIIDVDFPDVHVTFESELSLEEIIDRMIIIPDGHVMYQTVQPIEKYTGNRNYNL